ncbi:MAG TPA: MarR family transcriptional regulator [Acidimicrobiales bacterium]
MSNDGVPDQGKEREAAAGDAWQALYGLVFEREGQQRFHEACDAIGLAPGGMKTLLQLSPDQPVPMRDLAEYFRCDPSYVTSLVDGLESAGLAERRSHPTDRRVKMVALSHSGVDALAQVRKILGQPPASFAVLSTPELLRLRALLAKLERPPAG